MTDAEYDCVRRKLGFFFRQRGCSYLEAEDLIAESVTRLLTKERDGVTLKDPIGYVYGIAKHIVLEYWARPDATHSDIYSLADNWTMAQSDSTEQDQRDRCLTSCFEALSQRNQKVIAECLQAAPPLSQSLRVRKHRIIHSHLKPCVFRCMEQDAILHPSSKTGSARA
jgi:DNA-directed RNA polymerase specialized sigma24 family protein